MANETLPADRKQRLGSNVDLRENNKKNSKIGRKALLERLLNEQKSDDNLEHDSVPFDVTITENKPDAHNAEQRNLSERLLPLPHPDTATVGDNVASTKNKPDIAREVERRKHWDYFLPYPSPDTASEGQYASSEDSSSVNRPALATVCPGKESSQNEGTLPNNRLYRLINKGYIDLREMSRKSKNTLHALLEMQKKKQITSAQDSLINDDIEQAQINSLIDLEEDVEWVMAYNDEGEQNLKYLDHLEKPSSTEEPNELLLELRKGNTIFSFLEYTDTHNEDFDFAEGLSNNKHYSFLDFNNTVKFDNAYNFEDFRENQKALHKDYVESGCIWEDIRKDTVKTDNTHYNIIPAGADLGLYMRAYQRKLNGLNKQNKVHKLMKLYNDKQYNA